MAAEPKAWMHRSRDKRGKLAAGVAVAVALALALSACTSGPSPDAGSADRNIQVTELRGIAELQDRFNEDAGTTRLILLISPT